MYLREGWGYKEGVVYIWKAYYKLVNLCKPKDGFHVCQFPCVLVDKDRVPIPVDNRKHLTNRTHGVFFSQDKPYMYLIKLLKPQLYHVLLEWLEMYSRAYGD